ncbi:hypothetical protein McpCs1_11310 [Methanocorpusculaceae archaeon Cs1]|uniref:Uncharacterized protein n=1 Tax=Methanorbis rubei TaxID=3028300 RepID=A0AAE4SDM9_9EURY|nr:hypothetical protein [Methanocorpusculaceae archaeon Cs1]
MNKTPPEAIYVDWRNLEYDYTHNRVSYVSVKELEQHQHNPETSQLGTLSIW